MSHVHPNNPAISSSKTNFARVSIGTASREASFPDLGSTALDVLSGLDKMILRPNRYCQTGTIRLILGQLPYSLFTQERWRNVLHDKKIGETAHHMSGKATNCLFPYDRRTSPECRFR